MKRLLLIPLVLFVLSCEEKDKHGCLDSQACNYDSEATIENNSCIYELDCNGECGTAVVDCAGVCGGDADDSECVPGTYTLISRMVYQTSDCSGQGEDTTGNLSQTLTLNTDGTVLFIEWTFEEKKEQIILCIEEKGQINVM